MLVQFQLFARGIINRKCFLSTDIYVGTGLYLTPSCNVSRLQVGVVFAHNNQALHRCLGYYYIFTSLLFYVIPCFQEWLKENEYFYKARRLC